MLPATFDFEFETAGAVAESPILNAVGNTSVDLFGETITTTFAAGTAAVYDTTTQLLLIPLTASVVEFDVQQSLSNWSTIEGTAPIEVFAWANSSDAIDVNTPTAAAGIGSLFMRCAAGLAARWTDLLDAPLHLEEPILIANSDSVGVLDLTGSPSVCRQTFKLWQDPQNEHGTKADVVIGKNARYQFLSAVSGRESLGVSCMANVEMDRPVRVGGEPFPVRTAVATLVFSALDPGGVVSRRVSLVGGKPFASAQLSAAAVRARATAAANVCDRAAKRAVQGCCPGGGACQRRLEPGRGKRGERARQPHLPHALLPAHFAGSLCRLAGWGCPLRTTAAGAVIKRPIPSALNTPWEILTAHVDWSAASDGQPGPDTVVTSFTLAANPASAGGGLLIPPPVINEPQPDPNADGNILLQGAPVTLTDYGAIWDARTPRADNCALLDVSTNADLLGVSFRIIRGELMVMIPTQEVGDVPALLQVDGLDVVSKGAAVHAYLLPQVSWEPVINLAAPPILDGDPPSFLNFYPGDGGPSRLLNGSADNVALAPLPLAQYLQKQSQAAAF